MSANIKIACLTCGAYKYVPPKLRRNIRKIEEVTGFRRITGSRLIEFVCIKCFSLGAKHD
jgi:hypothetical protein